jgi:uncharacterized RDD family membrane protein YckC
MMQQTAQPVLHPMLDTLVRAEAPEGILLELRPAGISARLYAFLIDLMIRMAILFAASIALSWAGGMGLGIFLIVFFLIEWFYPVLFELTLSGATPGKRALGLTVVMDNGLPITPAASITRNLLRTADFLPFLYAAGAVSMLLRADFKRLGDIAAGTLVVYRDESATAPRANGAAVPDWTPLPPARALTPAEQAALVALAARTRRLTPERVEELARLAAAATGAGAHESATPKLLSVASWLYGNR